VPILVSGDTVETKTAAHRFYGNQDAIAQRSSPGLVCTRANRHTVEPRHLHQAQTDASVTIRPLILTPVQGVTHICAETDVLQR
jgi:hypothetical protein